MWVARDENGELGFFNKRPIKGVHEWHLYANYSKFNLYPSLFPNLKWEDEPIEVIIASKEDLIKRFEILNTMYQNTNPDNINDCSFKEYALKNWDNIDINYFNKIS